MNWLAIYGYGDDNAEVRGFVDGEIPCYDTPRNFIIGEGDSAVGVRIEHGGRGWLVCMFMPSDVDEDNWMPPSVVIHGGNIKVPNGETTSRYSPVLIVENVEGGVVCIDDEGEEQEIA